MQLVRRLQYIMIVLAVVGNLSAYAQTIDAGGPTKVWTNPVVYRASDQVTWYFDMTDTQFTPGENLYLWTWAPSEPDAENWENSSEFAKLTYEGDNVYSFTMIPADYYDMDAATINANDDIFWNRLKTKTGDKQSDSFQVPTSHAEWNAYLESGEAVKSYPTQFVMNQPLSILVDISKFTFNGEVGGLKNMQWNSINFHSGLDDWSILQEVVANDPAQVEKTKFKHVEGDIYRMDLVPMDYYGVDMDYAAENIQWLITTIQPDWAGTGDGPTLKASAAIIYPDPQLSFFPQKFCAKDILTLTRRYNGKADGELTFEIEAGSTTFSGTMTGNRDKQEAVVNLLDLLAGNEGISSIRLTITNANGMVVEETTLPIVPESEITLE